MFTSSFTLAMYHFAIEKYPSSDLSTKTSQRTKYASPHCVRSVGKPSELITVWLPRYKMNKITGEMYCADGVLSVIKILA